MKKLLTVYNAASNGIVEQIAEMFQAAMGGGSAKWRPFPICSLV
ncbi:hypothetical protein SAMN05216343_106133 [Oscillibacter sp. PC13]|nr:hypothetical protein [Oscillibacter sp. PC13]SFP36624.1 hypothetical protein SAMN05216343_106133 [Oscillibacter sp. PC13]